jgi:uncharacterized RDD family membrane protein YckC
MEYAGFWRRFVAYLIDFIILAIVQGPLGAFSGVLGALTGGFTEDTESAGAVMAVAGLQCLVSLVSLAISLAYYIGFWAWRGQTPGKMAMGVKIVRTDGSPITVGTALLRYMGYIVSTLILFIGFIMIAFDSRKQGLHDKIANTYVVRVQP